MIKRACALILFTAVCAIGILAQQPAPATQQPAPATQQPAQATQQPAAPTTHLKVGQQAPDFTLMDTAGKEVKLSDFKGKKNVVLAFYVLAFTGG